MAASVVYFVDFVDLAAKLDVDVIEIFLGQVLVGAAVISVLMTVTPIVGKVEQR